MAAGGITVEVIAETGSFETDMGRAAKAAERLQRQVERQVTALQRQAELAGKSSDEIKLYTLAQKQATEEQLKAAQAAIAQRNATEAAQKQAAAQASFLSTLKEEAASVGKTKAEILEMRAAQLGLTKESAPFIAALKEAHPAQTALGKSTAQTAQQMQFAAIQVKDFAQSVIAGQNPLIAFTQQGLTTVSIFGGLGNTFRALASVFTPFVIGVTAIIGATLTFATAAFKGREEIGAFQKSLILTNNALGLTQASADAAARNIAKLGSGTIGSARDAFQQLILSGTFGAKSIEAAGVAVLNFQRLTDKSAEQIIGDLKGMRDNVLSWSYESNKAYNFLTPKIYEQIRALQAAGKADEARKVALDALNETLGQKTPVSLGLLERALKSAKEEASAFWDSLLAVGRPETIEQRIAFQQKMVESALRGANEPETLDSFGRRRASGKERLARAQDILRGLQDQQRAEADGAARQRQQAKETNEALKKEQADFQSSIAALVNANAQKRLADTEAQLNQETRLLERAFFEREVDELEYARRSEKIAGDRVRARINLLEDEARADAAVKPTSEAEGNQQAAKRIQREAQLRRLEDELAAVAEKGRNFGFFPKAQDVVEEPIVQFRKFEAGQTAETQRGIVDRRQATLQGLADLQTASRDAAIGLIKDEQARAAAILQIELDTYKKRLDLGALNDDERKKAEDDFAAYVLLRQQQLVEDLKPAYQKQLEAWQDTARLMRESSDEFHASFIDAGREAFKEWLTNGKFSVSGLVKVIQGALSDVIYKRFIAAPLNNLAGGISSELFTKSDSPIGKLVFGSVPGSEDGGAKVAAGQALQIQQMGRLSLSTEATTTAVFQLASAAEIASAALARIAAASSVATSSSSFSAFSGLFGGDAGSGGGLESNAGYGQIFGEFAAGGRPPSGKPVLVGERGPEVFVPDGSGTIYPNTRGRAWSGDGGGWGGGPAINQYFNFATGVNANEMRAFGENIKRETLGELMNSRSRGNRMIAA